jgi:hypothetical protein
MGWLKVEGGNGVFSSQAKSFDPSDVMTLRTLQKRSDEKKANDLQTFLHVTKTLSEGKSLHAQKTLFSNK